MAASTSVLLGIVLRTATIYAVVLVGVRLSGKRGLPFSAQSTCYPGGVPGQLLTPAQPFYFIQTPNEVWMIWESDHMVRRIYMTDKHSEVIEPSWFGESIGHYE